MDDLPELPFEKVLSYLSLEDRLKARAVSRRWRDTINSFKVKSLCYSERPIGRILGKSRRVSGSFVRNFISCTRFASFFNPFVESILSNLKHLRFYHLHIDEEIGLALARTLRSFGQLEELDINFIVNTETNPNIYLELPVLNTIRLEGDSKRSEVTLTLDAPRLKTVMLDLNQPNLDFIHAASIETLIARDLDAIELKKLKNLKYLRGTYCHLTDSTLLSSLPHLEEIDLRRCDGVRKFFDQKQRYGRTDLKVFFSGCPLNGPDELPVDFDDNWDEFPFFFLAENESKLVDEMPMIYDDFDYEEIDRVAPELALKILKRFNLHWLRVDSRVQDTQRFLDFLKSVDIVQLDICYDQPQDLFDRLPEHCAVQVLNLYSYRDTSKVVLDFIFRLKHLLILHLSSQIDAEFIQKAFDELEFLLTLESSHFKASVSIQINEQKGYSVSTDPFNHREKKTEVPDLTAAIRFFFGDGDQKTAELA